MLHILLFYSWFLDKYLRTDLSVIKQPLKSMLYPAQFVRNIILCTISPIFSIQYIIELNTDIRFDELAYKFRIKTGL